MKTFSNTSAVFGLNWLQDVKPIEVSGAYDPEQELWISTTPPATAGYGTDRGIATDTTTFTGGGVGGSETDSDFDIVPVQC
jgi:hypothetical protein